MKLWRVLVCYLICIQPCQGVVNPRQIFYGSCRRHDVGLYAEVLL